jgi:hypothetical protein
MMTSMACGMCLRRINAWPPAIFQMPNLRHLVLHAHSTWARLPPALGQLASLETLEVKMAIEGGWAAPPPHA